MSKEDNSFQTFISIILGVLAIAAIWKLFKDDDSGQVVSKAGKRVLNNEESLEKINRALDDMKGHEDIVVDLN